MIEEVRKIVQQQADEKMWRYHIIPVFDYAVDLAEKLDADLKVVKLAALLHDIGRIKFGGKDHAKTGSEETVRILKDLGASEELITQVEHCVAVHPCKKGQPETKEAEIIANADAMAHFDMIPFFFYMLADDKSFAESLQWVEDKVNWDWENKLSLSEAKKAVKEKYQAAKLLIQADKR
jgi:putative nucleotidyltransferase with HDIG domain